MTNPYVPRHGQHHGHVHLPQNHPIKAQNIKAGKKHSHEKKMQTIFTYLYSLLFFFKFSIYYVPETVHCSLYYFSEFSLQMHKIATGITFFLNRREDQVFLTLNNVSKTAVLVNGTARIQTHFYPGSKAHAVTTHPELTTPTFRHAKGRSASCGCTSVL